MPRPPLRSTDRWTRHPPAALLATALVGTAVLLGACTDDDGGLSEAEAERRAEQTLRFCDASLEYLADRTPRRLADVVEASGEDAQVVAHAAIISGGGPIGRVLAATTDLDELTRSRCQAEWIGGAQGAGNTGAAATAFSDALTAGDRVGARNVASANAIAVFAPWRPSKTVIVEMTERAFVLAVDDDTLAECRVDAGVVVTCDVVRDD